MPLVTFIILLCTLGSAGVLLGLLQGLSDKELSHCLRAELSHVRAVSVHLASNHHWVETVRHRDRPEQFVDVLVGQRRLVLSLSGGIFLRLIKYNINYQVILIFNHYVPSSACICTCLAAV